MYFSMQFSASLDLVSQCKQRNLLNVFFNAIFHQSGVSLTMHNIKSQDIPKQPLVGLEKPFKILLQET